MGKAPTFDLEAFEQAAAWGEFGERALAVDLFGTRIETKRDYKCWREPPARGNLAVEFTQHSGPSGLATTEAEKWAFEFDDGCWLWLPVERLKSLVRKQHAAGVKVVSMGDNGNRGLLIPIQRFVEPVETEAI